MAELEHISVNGTVYDIPGAGDVSALTARISALEQELQSIRDWRDQILEEATISMPLIEGTDYEADSDHINSLFYVISGYGLNRTN